MCRGGVRVRLPGGNEGAGSTAALNIFAGFNLVMIALVSGNDATPFVGLGGAIVLEQCHGGGCRDG